VAEAEAVVEIQIQLRCRRPGLVVGGVQEFEDEDAVRNAKDRDLKGIVE